MTEANDRRTDAEAAQEDRRKADLELAQSVLRGRELPAQTTYELAERLRKVNEFGRARRLYGRIWTKGDWHLKVTAAKVGQQHALCTYKDPDLPAADRFQRALEILDEVDRLDLAVKPAILSPDKATSFDPLVQETEQRQESLGLRGAVYKRRWQVEGQRIDLEQALVCYLKGYQIGRDFPKNRVGVETDQGYNGINAAFVLDLMAREEARGAACAGIKPDAALERAGKAQEIRGLLAAHLPALVEREGYSWLGEQWWFHATIAEAHLGLGDFDKAIEQLRAYNRVHRLEHSGPPLERVARWEFESTLTQLAALAQLRGELDGLLQKGKDRTDAVASYAAQWEKGGRAALRDYLGSLAPALDRAEFGKVGLALSGGGFRASLFHIGVLAYLAERDALRGVEVLSCVSGGSIVGAHYCLEIQRILETTPDEEVTREDYIGAVERLQRDFLAGVQTNIRCQVFASIWSNLRAFLQPGYTPTRRLGELYERRLYARVHDERGRKPRCLGDLVVHPKGEKETFKPKYDNWRRRAKVPTLVLNATALNTGHNWQFTATWMGEPPMGLDAEIEGNYRLRRMYYPEAPRLSDGWRHWWSRPFAPPDYQRLRLGEAVAASSCVPGLFEPIVFPDLYPDKTVRLVDGGVYDNQGVASLLEQDCNVVIASDASGQMATQDSPKGGRLSVTLRSFSVSMSRVRQAEFRELAARTRSGLLKGLVFMHLKKDLDADPVDWRECQDPFDASDEARPAARRGVLTQYGIQKPVQRLLSGIRTDLDSFTELEAYSLMVSGYRQAEWLYPGLRMAAPMTGTCPAWEFLKAEKLLSPGHCFEEVKRQLDIGAKTAFKVWLLSPVLRVARWALVPVVVFGIYWLWKINEAVTLLTVKGLGYFAVGAVATWLAPHLVSLIRFRETARSLGLRSLAAAVMALVLKLHLLVFDPIFLKYGRLKHFRRSVSNGDR
jgi:predicted acylesterase/phospholipase RssA